MTTSLFHQAGVFALARKESNLLINSVVELALFYKLEPKLMMEKYFLVAEAGVEPATFSL